MPVRSAAWHAMDAPSAAAALGCGPGGLAEAEASRRLAEDGPNAVPRAGGPSAGGILLRQFKSPLIYILGIAALISLAVGDRADAAFIAGVLALNAAVGGVQEWRAERGAQALQKLLRVRAAAERGGLVRELDAERLVAGDLILLEPGRRVPADARLWESRGLTVDESLLTGESLAVSKEASALLEETTPLAERRNMVFGGTLVTRGRARAVVAATGGRTAVGRLALAAQGAAAGTPPLLLRMERFSRAIALVVLAGAAGISLFGWLVQGRAGSEMFLFAVALAVSAIPEGLPVALTIALAVAAARMARRRVIVRQLAAVEGLGSCSAILSDKTGTLTRNELTVREIVLPGGRAFPVTGQGYAPEGEVRAPGAGPERRAVEELALCAALSSEAELRRVKDGSWSWQGDPTEVALLSLARKAGVDRDAERERLPEEARIPFEPELRYSASFHRDAGGIAVFAKGAPERVAAMCADPPSAEALGAVRGMAERGLRVLAFAAGRLEGAVLPGHTPPEPSGLRWLGLAGLIDPPRPEARAAIAACREAGVEVAMVTGDHPVTAQAVARDLGLERVFARVDPEQKLSLVRAMQAEGHFVAVTGDGVNDAPALRAANIGVAMGLSGTDAAREAARLVIADDNFATIVAGIEEGRVAYDNARKVIYLAVSTGAAEVLLVALAVGFGLPLPLLPVQLLWLNLATNGIQDVALAFEPGERGVLRRPPRPPREPIFNRLMIERTLLGGAVMALVGSGAFWYLLESGWSEGSARNALLLLLVLFENFHIGNCRSETRSLFRIPPWSNPILLAGVIAAFSLHFAMLYLPFGQRVLRTEPVSLETWGALLALALSINVAMETHKWRRRRSPLSRRDGNSSRSS